MNILRKKMNALLCIVIVGCLLLITVGTFSFNQVQAYKLLDWDLVDGGKHMDWDGSTQYSTAWSEGIAVWNAHKSGLIRPDAWNRVQDVKIGDYSENGTVTVAYCSSAGKIMFNTVQMNNLSAAEQKHTVIHEVGHGLGIAHNNDTSSIMYPNVTSTTGLSQDDKNALDWLYKYHY